MNLFQFMICGEYPVRTDGRGSRLLRSPLGDGWESSERLVVSDSYLARAGAWVPDSAWDESRLRGHDHVFTEISFADALETVSRWRSVVGPVALLELTDAGPPNTRGIYEYIRRLEAEVAQLEATPLTPGRLWRWFVEHRGVTPPRYQGKRGFRIVRLPVGAHAVFAESALGKLWIPSTDFAGSLRAERLELRYEEIEYSAAVKLIGEHVDLGGLAVTPDSDGGMTPPVADFVRSRLAESGYPGELVRVPTPDPNFSPLPLRFDWRPHGADAMGLADSSGGDR